MQWYVNHSLRSVQVEFYVIVMYLGGLKGVRQREMDVWKYLTMKYQVL